LADIEEDAALLQAYLPPALGEVVAMIRDAVADGASDVGGVMKAVMPRTRGRFDGPGRVRRTSAAHLAQHSVYL
jgi:uncharacterized protein YqeY